MSAIKTEAHSLSVDSENWNNISPCRKRCRIEGKLLLFTLKKSHADFSWVLKSVILNDDDGVMAVILRYFI